MGGSAPARAASHVERFRGGPMGLTGRERRPCGEGVELGLCFVSGLG